MGRVESPLTVYLPQLEKEVKASQPLISRKIRSPLLSPSHQASASWPSLLAAGPGGAARLGLLPTAGRRGRAARGSRCRVAMETLPHPDCSWQQGPAAKQALGGDPRERARQAAHGAARPRGHRYDSPNHKHPSLILPRHARTQAPQLQQPRRNCSPSSPCSPHSLIQQTFADRLSARRELATAAAVTSHTGTQRHPHTPTTHTSPSPQRRQTQKQCDLYCDPNNGHPLTVGCSLMQSVTQTVPALRRIARIPFHR